MFAASLSQSIYLHSAHFLRIIQDDKSSLIQVTKLKIFYWLFKVVFSNPLDFISKFIGQREPSALHTSRACVSVEGWIAPFSFVI